MAKVSVQKLEALYTISQKAYKKELMLLGDWEILKNK